MKEMTCILCPVGCRLSVQIDNNKAASVYGNACKRGEGYGKQEAVSPLRMVTAVVKVRGRVMPLSVKTQAPIPKKDIAACMRAIEAIDMAPPVQLGQVVIENVCDSGVNVIATKEIN